MSLSYRTEGGELYFRFSRVNRGLYGRDGVSLIFWTILIAARRFFSNDLLLRLLRGRFSFPTKAMRLTSHFY